MATTGRDLTRRLAYVAVVLTAIGLFVAAGQLADTDGSPETTAGGAVESLIPGDSEETFQSNAVGIDLAAGWGLASLEVDGVEIPEDQWEVTGELGLYRFVPGDGQVMKSLPPVGTVTISATIFPLADPQTTRTVSWDVLVL